MPTDRAVNCAAELETARECDAAAKAALLPTEEEMVELEQLAGISAAVMEDAGAKEMERREAEITMTEEEATKFPDVTVTSSEQAAELPPAVTTAEHSPLGAGATDGEKGNLEELFASERPPEKQCLKRLTVKVQIMSDKNNTAIGADENCTLTVWGHHGVPAFVC